MRLLAYISRITGTQLSTGTYRGQLLLGGIGSLAIKSLNTLLAFLVAVLLARVLGAEGYGVYAFSFTLLSLLWSPVYLGLPHLVVREVAKYRAKSDWTHVRGVIQWVTRVVVVFSLVMLLITGGMLWLGSPWLDPSRHMTLIFGLLLLPLLALSQVAGAALRGLQRVILGQLPVHVLSTLFFITLIALSAWLVPGRSTPPWIISLHGIAALVALALSWWLLVRYSPDILRSTRHAQQDPVAWRRAAMSLGLISGIQFINGYTDILMVGLLRTDAEVGVYRVAAQTSGLVVFGLTAMNMVLHPHFSRLHAEGDHARLQKLVTFSSAAIFILAVPPMLLFTLAGRPILDWVFGEEFAAGHVILSILVIGQLVNAGFGSVGALLNMTGHENDTLRGMTVAALANVTLNLVLIPAYGTTGAAIATTLSLVIWNVLLRRYVWKRLGIESSIFFTMRKGLWC